LSTSSGGFSERRPVGIVRGERSVERRQLVALRVELVFVGKSFVETPAIGGKGCVANFVYGRDTGV
jgi:hypothetical protein